MWANIDSSSESSLLAKKTDICYSCIYIFLSLSSIPPLPFSVSQEPSALNVMKNHLLLYSKAVFLPEPSARKTCSCYKSQSLTEISSSWETFGWVLLKFFPSNIHNRSSYQGFIALTPLSVVYPCLCLHF